VGATHHDRGLGAVARVRGIREQDARIGLQLALNEEQLRERQVDALLERLSSADPELADDPVRVAEYRRALMGLGGLIQEKREAVVEQNLITADARSHWQAAANRLEIVEQLLARRAAQRQLAQAREEAKELDDVASVRFATGRQSA